MPIYQITAPNGRTYRIEGPPGASDADVARAVLAQFPEAGKAPAESTIMGELVRGGKQLASSIRTGLESITSPEEAARAGVERGEKIAAEAGEGPSFAAVRKAYGERGLLPAVGEAVSQIPRALAGQGAQLAAMAGGARLGAMAGAPFGPVGAVVGGIGGAGATLLPQFMGANVERQAKEQIERGEPVSIDRAKAYGAAAGQAALEGAGTAFTLGKRVVKGVLGIADDAALATAKAQQELAKAAARSMAASAGRGALRGTTEIPVEIAQAVLERAQAGLDLTSPDALEEYGENAYLAGLVGPTIGSAAGVAERRSAQRAQAATAPTEAPIERAERLAAEKAKAEAPPPAAPPAEIPPVPESYVDLVLYTERLKLLPKSKERDAALKEAYEKRKALVIADVEAQRGAAEKAKGFMTAEEAAAAQITPREEVTPPETPPAPPAAETPTPPVEEPKVKKLGEPPPTGLQPADIEALGISKKQPIYRRMLGKDMDDPAQRDTVLADIEKYLVAGNGSEDSRTKLTEFKTKFAPAETPAALTTAPEVPVTETPSAVTTQPEAGGAGAPVAGEPGAGAAPRGAGVVEPSGVVPSVADVEQPAGGEGQQPAPVTPPAPAPAPAPAQVERELTALVEAGRITEEQAAAYREELLGEVEEAPQTTMGQAFQKQVDSLKAQMNALRQNSGKPPAPKSKNRAKFDELQAKLNALLPTETGTLTERLEKAGATGVFQVRDGKPILDIPAVREALKNRDPKMLKAVLTYIGVDEDGNYLPTTYSADEAAESVGLKKSSGANVRRTAETLGITADVISRFQAAQTGVVGIAKNVSEASLSGIAVENPKAGILYEAPVKPVSTDAEYDALVARVKELEVNGKEPEKDSPNFKEYKAADKALRQATPAAPSFLRPALTRTGQLDFSKLDMRQLADIYSRASRYDAKDNAEVMEKLGAEVDARREKDRKGTDAAINRAYGKLVEEEETQAETEAETVEEAPEEAEAEDRTVRLSDEEIESETRARETIYPDITPEAAQYIQEQIQGKSLIEAAQFTADLFKEGDQKLIAEKTVERLRRMEAAGVKFGFVVVENGTRAPTSVASGTARGVSVLKFTNGKPDITVYLRAHDLGSSGINPRIMLHEFLHAATQAGIELGVRNAAVGSDISRMTISLIEAQRAFAKHFNARIAEFKAGKTELSEIEEAMYNRNVNAGVDAHEFLAWGLTSPKFQQYLETIPYKGRSLWTKFVDSIRSFLGMSPQADTLLSELLHVSEEILNADPNEEIAVGKRILGTQQAPAVQSAAITPQTEEAVKGLDVIGEQDKRTFGQRVARELKGNPALRLREKLTDSLAPLEDLFVNAYGGATRTAAGRLNPMVLLSRALDALRVSKAAQEIGGLGREDGLIVAKALPVNYKDILKRIADAAKERKQTYEEFRKTVDTVLYGHREYNLREKNKTLPKDEQIELLLKDHQIDRLEAAFQQDDFIKGISADLDTIRFNLLDTLVDTGRISAEQAQDYKDAIGYIPFERIGEYENQWNNATRGSNRGVAALKKMRSLEGSDRKSTSVVENFSGLMDWATKEAMKNEAALRALKDMELLGAAVKRPTKPKTDAPGDIVKVFDGGKETAYYVPDPAHLVAFSIADPQLSKVLKAFQRGSQVLRAGVTAMPPFAIKQVFDDVIRAYTYAGVKNNGELVKNVLFNFPKNWVNEVMRRESKGVRELKNLGIVGTFDFTQQTNLKDILEEAGAKKEGIGSAIIRVMEAGAKASDLAVREAIYKQVLKETGDKAQAESAAREIINFSRRGSSKIMGQMISIIPFFNAYARGMDKLATAAAGKVVGQSTGTARSMFYQRMGVLTAMGLAYALMMQDDEEYNKLPDHVRDTNWVLPYGKELGFTPVIPIPAELAFFFKAIPERIVRYYKYQGTEEEQAAMSVLGELTKRGIDVFSSPNVTPQVLRPFLENIVNYSFFLGRPLESQAQLQLRPFERYGTGTSDAMKAVARGLEDVANATGIDAFAVSPIKLENAVRGLMGTAAGLTLSMADMVVNPDRTDRPLHQQLAPQLTGASAVMKTAVGTRFMDEIYDLEKRVEQVNGTYNRLLKTQPEKAEGYLNDNIGIYSIRGPVQGIMDAIRTLNEAAMTIDRDTSLSPEERRKLIDELRVEQNEIARVVFSLRKQARDIQAGL